LAIVDRLASGIAPSFFYNKATREIGKSKVSGISDAGGAVAVAARI
jgi:hypothetical protein